MNAADLAGTNLDLTSAPDLTPADDLGPAVDLVGADLSDFPSINITNVTSDESNAGTKAFTFTLTLSLASTAPVTVAWTTVDNTATAPADYTAASGVVTFAPGVTTQTITVQVVRDTIVNDDSVFMTIRPPASPSST